MKLIDVNVSIGSWPFTDLPATSAATVWHGLAEAGIDHAYTCHLGAVFNPDPSSSNTELLSQTAPIPELSPVITENPAFPGWEKRLDTYRATHHINTLKIYPQYHNYALASDVAAPLIEYAIANNMRLLVCMRLEDERTRYFGLNIVGVPVDDVIKLSSLHPELSLICLNAYLPEAKRIAAETSNVSIDTSFVDWFLVLEELVGCMSSERILFGSHTPFLYTKANVAKLTESRISEASKKLIASENAIRFF